MYQHELINPAYIKIRNLTIVLRPCIEANYLKEVAQFDNYFM